MQFLTFLKRLDAKQQVLDKFNNDFNEFSDQYPDMREDDQTKEELHQIIFQVAYYTPDATGASRPPLAQF